MPARRLRLSLPAAGKRPHLPGEGADPRQPAALTSFTVPGIALSPGDCLALLPPVRAEPAAPLAGIVGGSLAWWAHAARFALELLARQRFLPALVVRDDVAFAVWKPVFTEPRDAERVAALARAAPGACFALAPTLAPRVVVEDFLGALVDAGVRASCDGMGPPLDAADGVGGQWMSALLAPSPSMPARPAQLVKLERGLTAWAAPLGDTAAFRTALRLDPPAMNGGGAAELAVPGLDAPWALRYHLQASDDPSLLVPADRVWADGGAAPEFTSRGFATPQERLLADLGRAARLFPPIARSLQGPAPAHADLDTAEAERFFRDAAPLLAEAGLGVLLPGVKPLVQALKVRVRATPREQEKGPKRFGLQAIVDFQFEVALGDQVLTEQDLLSLAELKSPLVRVRGQWVHVRPGDVEAARALWAKRRSLSLGEALQDLARGEIAGVPVEVVEADGWLRALLDPDRAGLDARLAKPPKALRATLRPYQARGLAWLLQMRGLGLGALLADDMGLGKTVQVLALLLAAEERGARAGPALVVCPASVAGNWEREAQRFAPSLKVLVHHGSDRAAAARLQSQAKAHDLVVTTYGTLVRDREALGRVAWDTVVLDEAQNVKNRVTKQAQAARSIEGGHRVALTGTPVENRLSELWSISQFLNPGYLGSSEAFRQVFALPVERYGDAAAAARLRRLVQPFLLRREKTDPTIAPDLPDKIETPEVVHLTREQASLYEAVVADTMRRVAQARGIERRGIVLAALTRLKQLCNHPAHFLADGSPLPGRSGKLKRLDAMLEEVVQEGHSALVFTQFKEMGLLLQPHLERRFGEVLFLHGAVPRKARDAMVARFQEPGGPRVFLLSLKAGGTGLNLTAASHVFHFDRWWNPAVEDQATDRAFRIGQTKNVQVHKFVTAGTLEERIDAVLKEKKGIAASVVGTGEAWLTEMSDADLRALLTLRPDAVAAAGDDGEEVG